MVWAQLLQAEEQSRPAPTIDIAVPIYDFNQVAKGEVVKHDFRVLNRGTADLEIKQVKPG